jgi:hypothetical protein
MKIDVLKEYIRKTIREELRIVLKEEIKYQLTEIFLGTPTKVQPDTKRNVMRELKTESVDFEDELISGEETSEEVKPMVKYSSNPVLNKILNETKRVPIPQEDSMVGLMDGGFNSGMRSNQLINEIKVPDNAPEPVKTVYQAMTKDYRSLMKAVDKKRGGVSK